MPGTVIAMHSWERPAPGVFLYHDVNTTLENIKVHYAEGNGPLGASEREYHAGWFLRLLERGGRSAVFHDTQAGRYPFLDLQGTIISRMASYRGMMDDAINVHGTYLKVVRRVNDSTLVGRYMHPQSYGFEWGG